MHIEIIAEDKYHPDIWHNRKMGQIFEVVKIEATAIPPRYHVKYNHPSGQSKVGYVSFHCARQVKIE